ncbi:MAG: carboxymuconolactone decarboxylase family protein [Pseudomonadota bacterium]
MSKPEIDDAFRQAQALAEAHNPGITEALRARYDAHVPGLAEMVINVSFGEFYRRPGLDIKTRYLATIAALTVLGAQTKPQLQVHVQNALNAGASKTEIAETIYQMALYGGFPAMINALNAAIEVFERQETA